MRAKSLLGEVEAGRFVSRLTPDRRRELVAVAEATVVRDSRINLRLSSRDLELLKRQAAREGLPYQTYLASVLHKVATGQR
jgi:predicted DNA binding CopG/RHH family protein